MKKTTLIAFLIFATVSRNYAQYNEEYRRVFKPFKVGVGVGYAVPGAGEGAAGGFLLNVEPAYRATDQVLVGLRLQDAFLVRGIKGVNNRAISGDASSIASYTLNALCYFNSERVRPFIGAGVGLFSLTAVRFNTAASAPGADHVGAETRFGFYPMIGLEIAHFNLILDYNVIPPTDVPDGGEVKNNYLGIRAGFSIGGGRTDRRF